MKKWYLALIIFLSIVFPGHASAQGGPTIDSLEIDLWPEYDKPEILVIYRVELSAEVSPPVELKFRIPIEAGEPHAVAVRDSDGSLLTAPYERSVEGDWSVISLIATMPGIQIEYYDPQILKDNSNRAFQFTWPGDYQIGSLSIQVQKPFDASDVKISPAENAVFSGSDGLSYHTIDLGGQLAGVPTNVNIEYKKPSDQLSVEGLPVQPVAPISSNITGRMNMSYIPWGLGILGLSLLTGGVYWYWQLGKQQQKPKTSYRRRRSAGLSSQSKSSSDDTVYCFQCGKRAAVSDRFCRSCGTKLRKN